MIGQNALFSRNSDEWETPQELFDELDREFYFDLDPCASDENHKCDNYYTIEDDGLDKIWDGWGQYFAIPHTARSQSGLRSVTGKDKKTELLW